MTVRPRHALGRAMHTLAALVIAAPLAIAVMGAAPATARADGLTMSAHALLHGRIRAGAWFGIAVDIGNAGPAVTGELRVQGGSDGLTQFGQPVEVATGSRKTFELFAQPNGAALEGPTVDLVAGDKVVASAKVSIAATDDATLAVGVLAENPAKLIGEISLPTSTGGSMPAVVPLTVADLPDRVQAWATLDRLVWQDVDASTLSTAQLAALRAWVAGGGRLVIVGGTSSAAELSALPDDLLPYRPTATLDVDPSVLRSLLGGVPTAVTPLPALAGTLAHGRALATSGDRTVAADLAVGSGSVTLLGFDPTTSWLAAGDTWDTPLWRRLLPARGGAASMALADDSTLVSNAVNLPSMTLPPTGGLLALLIAYIVLVGPVNYLVLRVLDRREWAWVTVPVLIAAFTAAAFGIGVVARGSDVVLHQIAIVRGAQGTDLATAQAWTAVFSPSRTAFQVSASGDTLLSAPLSAFGMNGQPSSGLLDVVEGDPTRLRDFTIGYGSVRTIRSDGSTAGPTVDADLHLDGSTVKGTITNRSSVALADAAFVLGNSVDKIGDIAPGATVPVELSVTPLDSNGFMMLSDRLVDMSFIDGRSPLAQQQTARHSIIDQLTQNSGTGIAFGNGNAFGGGVVAPMAIPAGMPGSSLSQSAMLLAWGTSPVLPLTVEGAQARATADVLYEVPVRMAIRGSVEFTGDLLPSAVTSMTAMGFSKDPTTIWMGTGDMTTSYRPLAFEGTFTPRSVTLAMNHPGDMRLPGEKPVDAPIGGRCASGPSSCSKASTFPDVDLYDVRGGQWVELGDLTVGTAYTLPDPARWVDPTTGEIQVKFVNQSQDQLGFQFPISIVGTVQ